MSEQEIQQRIRLACSRDDARLFRNNVGQGWIGRMERRGRDVLLRDARPLQAGLSRGSADLIGWKTVTITPDMVGQRVAVFASVEVKAARGSVRPDQRTWLELVRAAGGIAGVVRSVEEAQALLRAGPGG